jgi:hypothetical protein
MASAVAMLATATAGAGPQRATRIHVRGGSHLDARASRDGGELVLSGLLEDDAHAPIPGETLWVRGIGDARDCAPRERPTVRAVPGSPQADAQVITDEAGRFCVRSRPATLQLTAVLEWKGSPSLEATTLDLAVDLSRASLALSFDPVPRAIRLDDSGLTVTAVALVDDGGITRARGNLPLTLTDERGQVVASAVTSSSGRATFSFDASKLAGPGRGELRVSFAGDVDTASATHHIDVERQAKVVLASDEKLTPKSPEDGIAIPVRARWRGGDVGSGSLEARVGETLVGAGRVETGKAKVTVTFASGAWAGNEVPVTIRYAPAAPWWIAGDDLHVRVPVAEPSAWRQVPLALAGLAVVAWLVLGRSSRRAKPAPAVARERPQPLGEPGVEIVAASHDPRVGWKGRVLDAHDRTPVSGAQIVLRRPGFDQTHVLASVVADDRGQFELAHESVRPDDELVVEGPFHASLRQPAPPNGEIVIALVLRKRKLLERLVAWARLRGNPFDVKPEATPGHVRKAAGDDFRAARWADEVERAAYGGGDVDARMESEIDRLEPPPLRGAREPEAAGKKEAAPDNPAAARPRPEKPS